MLYDPHYLKMILMIKVVNILPNINVGPVGNIIRPSDDEKKISATSFRKRIDQ